MHSALRASGIERIKIHYAGIDGNMIFFLFLLFKQIFCKIFRQTNNLDDKDRNNPDETVE